jgi:enoyl-CoA hydratase
MSDTSFVRVERSERIATVAIDRQDKLNALNPQVIAQLRDAFESLRNDESVRGVILTGAGQKAFVAGADIGVLAEMNTLSGVAVSREGQAVFRAIERFPKPVVAAVGGYALGGGCELALACHLRVASEKARFGLPEVTLGIIPGYGGTIRLARLVGLGRALDMTLTGRMVGAEEALEMGLVNRVVAAEALMDETRELVGQITRNAPVALRMALESVYGALEVDSERAEAFESSLFGLLASTADMREGMAAFLEKRSPEFDGR